MLCLNLKLSMLYFIPLTQIFKHLQKKLKYDMAGDKEVALTFIDNSIPQNIKNQLDKSLKGNFDFE